MECLLQTLQVIDVGLNNLGAQCCKLFCLVRVGVSRNSAGGEARAAKALLWSFKMARTRPPPCAPVAPTIAMIFFSVMTIFLLKYCN
jgi:hypothetical protein